MIRRTAALAALTLTLTTGCARATTEQATPPPSAGPTAAPVAAGPPWYDDVAPATAATTVGPEGSACQLAMTFSVPAQWKVEAVTAGREEFTLGPAVPVCEIDAKPAGHIGFLRIWQIEAATPLSPQEAVDKYLAAFDGPKEQQYRKTKAGPLDAFEATWTEEGERKRALLVSTGSGRLMVTLGGLDTEEFEAMLPAYQLAKSSVHLPK
ncbi:lipoprotein [Micromonospora sp. NPDC051925]|uniref:lipoprotein n=1 Tax=Micromonospora sp. NPDC051925 TaxID=3364288 RepID=UPI0037C985DF